MNLYLGIDVGSVSTNVIAIDNTYDVIFNQYIRSNGQPIETVKRAVRALGEKIGFKEEDIIAVGATGSGRQLAGVIIGADVIKNEITCHASAAVQLYPDVRTIFEIGGQDSKIIFLQDGMVVDFSMNTVCAAGTGSFLDHQSERLGIPIQEFGEYALRAEKDVRIAGRCTVFAESDMIAKQQYGFSKEEIINGLCNALVRNYLNNLGRGKKLEPPFLFQGGVAANIGIRAAFERIIGHSVIVPKYYDVMGAIGAAILAKEQIESSGEKTVFRGFNASELSYVPSMFECNDCANLCEVMEVDAAGEVVAMWGDKCGKWTASAKTKKVTFINQ